MIYINYQSYGTSGFSLRLRFYQDGETKFLAVNKLLKGKLLKKHWNQRKQCFIPSAPYSEENNAILVEYKQRYDRMAIEWTGSLYGFLAAVHADNFGNDGPKTVAQVIEFIITELKRRTHADGSVKGSYEGYAKLEGRLKEFCEHEKIEYDKLLITDINSVFINNVMDWIVKERQGKGHVYISAMLHATLAKAEKQGWFDMSTVKNCRWRGKNKSSVQKYHTLSTEQCRKFVSLTKGELPHNPNSELYHDFCIFILYTGQSPCDAIALRYSDIKNIGGVDHFVFKRRKISEKQAIPCAVPINDRMKEIMDRWKSVSKDGYIFPIRSKRKLATQKTSNGDIKHFISLLNHWLKKIGDILECDFSLHTYTFRHTAITNYISKGVPVLYVANLMGTSVKNCESIYYNNQGDVASRNKVLNAIQF
ncbi:hypothetical protein E5358_12810 [Palleniella muris]|uniref:Uncharacterized protein n=1 Tax=Palleniella muris TaxID=3038145 RepID=A0AC61QMP0_9BACT|nr:tyrosine-type recombinase/integrase [Palleniella muris]TGX80530.1 hypothetical protein E5358_12810 [Palleniella muris]